MEKTKQIFETIQPGQSIGIFIGPEGGFDESEIVLAQENGISPITLGKRILRTETAGMAVLSVLMFQCGGQRIMQAYLDNSATTRCSEGVRDIVVKVMMEDFGNPSSRHDKGMEAEKYLREARMDIAATLKADEKEIYFTSGGTESDNWALIGARDGKQTCRRNALLQRRSNMLP